MKNAPISLLLTSLSLLACGGAATGSPDGSEARSHGAPPAQEPAPIRGDPGVAGAAGAAGVPGEAGSAGAAGDTGWGGDPGWGGSCGSSGWAGGPGEPGGGPTVDVIHAIAVGTSTPTSADTGDQGGTGGSGGAPPVESDESVALHLGSSPQLCADPHAAHGCSQWSATFVIPAARLVAGATFALDGSDIVAFSTASGPARATPDDCWFGAGSFFSGTLEVVSADEATVVARVTGADAMDFVLDAEVAAPRCR